MNFKKALNPKCLVYSLFLYTLKLRYGLDIWHWRSNFYCRKYKKIVVRELNKLPIEQVTIDLGGGLGEILGRLKTKENILIDLDEKALKASEKIPGLKITKRIKGSWKEAIDLTPNTIDIFIAINWIHGVKPKELTAHLENILKRKKIKFLLVDSLITPSNNSFKHDFKFLEKLGYKIAKRFDDGGENLREFIIFEKIKL
jgi:hypothetical protein